MSLFKFEFVVYHSSGGYVDLVQKLAEDNMDRAVSEVKDLSEYNVMGEVSSTVFSEDYLSVLLLFVCLLLFLNVIKKKMNTMIVLSEVFKNFKLMPSSTYFTWKDCVLQSSIF